MPYHSTMTTGTEQKPTPNRPTFPRAIIHKQILDTAADHPDASIDAIAADVPSATTDLVEHVLDEYGDPAEDSQSEPGTDTASADQEEHQPDPTDLTDKQLETLRAIYEHPTASQCEIGELLDVTGATVSNRVNAIDGIDWENRQDIVMALFESPPTETASTPDCPSPTPEQETMTELHDRVTSLEQTLDELVESRDTDTVFEDSTLLYKIIHACMESETITTDEELQIIEGLIQ